MVLLKEEGPATLLGRVQASFNTSSVRSQWETLSPVGPRHPAPAVGGSAWALPQSLGPRGSLAGDDLWV